MLNICTTAGRRQATIHQGKRTKEEEVRAKIAKHAKGLQAMLNSKATLDSISETAEAPANHTIPCEWEGIRRGKEDILLHAIFSIIPIVFAFIGFIRGQSSDLHLHAFPLLAVLASLARADF